MEETSDSLKKGYADRVHKGLSLIHKFNFEQPHFKIFAAVLVLALIAGIGTGYFLSSPNSKIIKKISKEEPPKDPQQDRRTFRDFAEGVIEKRPEPEAQEEYGEGTHLLKREGAVSVALTSSVVDLSKYEGKKVKVLGETQKAIKEGWLMDVGKVEEQK